VIPTSGAISIHMGQCAAIAEIECGQSGEHSLFAAPDGQSHVQPKLVLYKHDPWAGPVKGRCAGEAAGRGRDGLEEEADEEGKWEDKEKGTEGGRAGGGLGVDAGSLGRVSNSAASVLLSLSGKVVDGWDNGGNRKRQRGSAT
jgi:hypothetical protein